MKMKRLLMTLVAIVALLVAASPSALAASRTPTSPDINRVTCVGNDFLKFYTDFGKDIICFANPGTLDVAIYNTGKFYSGNNYADLVGLGTDGNTYQCYLGHKYTDYYTNKYPPLTSFYEIQSISIYSKSLPLTDGCQRL